MQARQCGTSSRERASFPMRPGGTTSSAHRRPCMRWLSSTTPSASAPCRPRKLQRQAPRQLLPEVRPSLCVWECGLAGGMVKDPYSHTSGPDCGGVAVAGLSFCWRHAEQWFTQPAAWTLKWICIWSRQSCDCRTESDHDHRLLCCMLPGLPCWCAAAAAAQELMSDSTPSVLHGMAAHHCSTSRGSTCLLVQLLMGCG